MFSPPKISWVVSGIKYICLYLLTVFYLIQPSRKQIICFDFQKQNSVLPVVFYVPWCRLKGVRYTREREEEEREREKEREKKGRMGKREREQNQEKG
jgi:hypothetical protein